MAEGSGKWLLAVALLAACVSGVAVASSSPGQVPARDSSVVCHALGDTSLMRTLRASLLNIVKTSDSADLCKRLNYDLDLPMLSELHRQLVGEGSHRRLVYHVKFANCPYDMVNFLDSYDANLVVIENLPNRVFADPFELQHFVERKVFLDVAVFGDTNLELPSALSNRSAVEIHVDLRPNASMNLVINLPLHARYPPLDASGYATVEFGSPDLLLRYRKKEILSDSCFWVLKDLNAAHLEKIAWRIPCGDEAHRGFVSSITFLSALVCSIFIVIAALFY